MYSLFPRCAVYAFPRNSKIRVSRISRFSAKIHSIPRNIPLNEEPLYNLPSENSDISGFWAEYIYFLGKNAIYAALDNSWSKLHLIWSIKFRNPHITESAYVVKHITREQTVFRLSLVMFNTMLYHRIAKFALFCRIIPVDYLYLHVSKLLL